MAIFGYLHKQKIEERDCDNKEHKVYLEHLFICIIYFFATFVCLSFNLNVCFFATFVRLWFNLNVCFHFTFPFSDLRQTTSVTFLSFCFSVQLFWHFFVLKVDARHVGKIFKRKDEKTKRQKDWKECSNPLQSISRRNFGVWELPIGTI